MAVNFEFNAPQFVNYSDDPDADRFFDVAVEIKTNTCQKKSLKYVDDEIENKDPCLAEEISHNTVEKEKSPVSRKILNEIANKKTQSSDGKEQSQDPSSTLKENPLLQAMENLSIGSEKRRKSKIPVRVGDVFEGILIERAPEKKHNMTTRLDSKIMTPILKLRNRSIVKQIESPPSLGGVPVKNDENDGEVTFPRSHKLDFQAIKRKGSPLDVKRKFISLAERVQHFHYDTPDRFRTIPRNQDSASWNFKPSQTIPKTPLLQARFRHRPVNFPNEKEREELELEEIKKHQIRAHPLNEKILKGPVLKLRCPVEKKPTTIPEPFRLSEFKKKEQARSPVFVFKAQPVPATILNRPVGVPPKRAIRVTVPLTPKIKCPEKTARDSTLGIKTPVTCSSSTHRRTTKVEPFSFDQKIKDVLLKKQENFEKVLEEEKKNFNSFRAQPLPAFLGRGVSSSTITHRTTYQGNNISLPLECKRAAENSAKKTDIAFKARPASIIHQKPFVPILSKHHRVFTNDFRLETEKRAIERQKFDDKIKKKEEDLARILKEQEEEEERLEKLKTLEERKLTEFKAKPVPKYKPFEIMPSNPSLLTSPQSQSCFSSKQ